VHQIFVFWRLAAGHGLKLHNTLYLSGGTERERGGRERDLLDLTNAGSKEQEIRKFRMGLTYSISSIQQDKGIH
jgi:hypothetical protein